MFNKGYTMKKLFLFTFIITSSFSYATMVISKNNYIMDNSKQLSKHKFQDAMLYNYSIDDFHLYDFAKNSYGVFVHTVNGNRPQECYYPIYNNMNKYYIENKFCKMLFVNDMTNPNFGIYEAKMKKIDIKDFNEDYLYSTPINEVYVTMDKIDTLKNTILLNDYECKLKKDDDYKMFMKFSFSNCNKNIVSNMKDLHSKTILYKSPLLSSQTKSYLIKGDKVTLLDTKIDKAGQKWFKISYKGKKEIKAWIKAESVKAK